MPPDPKRELDLDERTARLGRQWFAEIRETERDQAAADRRRPARGRGSDGEGGLWDWLTGDGDADGSGGDH